MQKKALVVVGPHRSGTSAITRICSFLGAGLPRNMLSEQPDNMFGYWEPLDLVQADDDILSVMGSSWDDIRPLGDEWFSSELAGKWMIRLRRIIEEQYAAQDLFVIKDPRLSRLLPMLTMALRSLSVEPHILIAVRNPMEVARSLCGSGIIFRWFMACCYGCATWSTRK
jgi:hypothetical protein